ncbi:MAG: CRISPR-associated endonuclease Cas1 [bacterium]
MQEFSSLSWHRLSVTLVNIRMLSSAKAHPVSIFQAIIKGVSILMGIMDDPSIFFHIRDKRHTYKLRESDKVLIDIFFCGYNLDFVKKWSDAFKTYLSNPDTGRNFDIIELGEPEERTFEKVFSETGEISSEREICLEFLIPFSFKPKTHRTSITKTAFINSFENRLSKLFGKEFKYSSQSDNFSVLPYYWDYTQISHPSQSQQGRIQYINGCVGRLYIKGKFSDLLPFIILGSELHTGTKTSNAQGYYLLHKEPQGYFDKNFPNQKSILSIIKDVIDKYDNALESLSIDEKFSFNEEVYAEKLFHQITENNYIPSPNIAFLIKKKDSVDRLVEQLQFKDLIVQQYVLKTISENFDRIFEKESIGFRKGVSREKSIELVQSAIGEGYQFVIESDVEDFFPSVDLDILTRLLEFYIPQKDICLKNIIQKCMRNGYILNGTYYARIKGLAQGSPLSPILANLYLDSFDEQMQKFNVRMIRYADDFVILTRTKEDAENILSQTESFLSGLGLKIKKEKTNIKHIKDGFQFLGISFTGSEVKVESEDEMKRFKKPLYITEPYTFLSLNGDAIDILKNREIIETIPIRRISEIMVMEKTVFSTALITKCTDNNIPFTIVLNTGYYITTIKPDSKKYYDITFAHAKKYYSLSETEIFSIAKEFAVGKLNNYISLFKQKYVKEQNLFINEIERVIQNIYQAADIHEVRGLEGSTAKKIYQKLNVFIDNEIFQIEKRDRRCPDRINSLLNFGYYLLFSRINATVRAVGLNPYLGFLHSPLDDYESFVCDIEELFRARIDRFIIRLVNLKVITKDDFVETERGFYLKKEGVKSYLNQFEAEMERKTSENSLSLKENIYVQVNIIKNFMLENKSLTFYIWKV